MRLSFPPDTHDDDEVWVAARLPRSFFPSFSPLPFVAVELSFRERGSCHSLCSQRRCDQLRLSVLSVVIGISLQAFTLLVKFWNGLTTYRPYNFCSSVKIVLPLLR